jgi:CBS domain-containing protein
MQVIERLRRSGVGLNGAATVKAAAEVMEAVGVGAIVVVDGAAPVGIVTDRDLVRRGLAKSLPDDARLDAVMTTPVITIEVDADIHDAFDLIGRHGIRRLVVVDGDRFVGVVSHDDLLVELTADLRQLGRAVAMELHRPSHDPGLPAPL